MSEKTKPTKNHLLTKHNRDLLLYAGVLAGAAATAVVVAHARSDASRSSTEANSASPSVPSAAISHAQSRHLEVKPGQTKLKIEKKPTPQAQAEAYVASPERSAKLKAAMDEAAEKMVSAAATGKVGGFDFYNGNTDKWGMGAGNEGWGYLQHNPQYGGSKTQMNVAVYHKADGSFDLNKGVLEAQIGMHDGKHRDVELSAPKEGSDLLGVKGDTTTTYSASLVETPSLTTVDASHESTRNTTAHELRVIDNTAIAQFAEQMDASGL